MDQEETHTFGVLTQRVAVDRTTGDESESHFLRIIDEQTFERMYMLMLVV